MSQLEKRVERLEGATAADDKVKVIFIAPMTADNGKPAEVQPETTGARCMTTGEHLPRSPGEGMGDFQARATAWAIGRKEGVSVLLLTDGED